MAVQEHNARVPDGHSEAGRRAPAAARGPRPLPRRSNVSEAVFARLDEAWRAEKKRPSPSLVRATFKFAGVKNLAWGWLCPCVVTVLQFVPPLVSKRLIDFSAGVAPMSPAEQGIAGTPPLTTRCFLSPIPPH